MLAGNDAALPRPPDETGRLLEAWCQQCHSMCPRPLQPMDLQRVAKATLPARQCTACKHGEYVPQPGDIPEPLLGWKPKVLAALRPIDIDLGSYQRAPHGYRVHTAMINFAWAEKSVWSKIQALTKKKNRKQAEAALTYLLKAEQSAYAEFYARHEDFLDQHGTNTAEKVRKRPLRFIEELPSARRAGLASAASKREPFTTQSRALRVGTNSKQNYP